MRIALLTDGIWPFVIGGMQKHSYYLCKYLSKSGIHVDLYHTTKNGAIPNLAEVFSDDEMNLITSYYVPYPSSDKLPGHYLRTSYKYSKLIYGTLRKNDKVDIIYVKGLAGWETLRKKQQNKDFPPVCLNVHGYEYYQKAASIKTRLQQLMLRPTFKYLNKRADYIYSYGAGITDIIRNKIGRSTGIIEIPAGIEKDFIRHKLISVNSPRVFVFIGRFERRKGIQELMKALNMLNEDGYSFKFKFIGAIPQNFRLDHPSFSYLGETDNKETIKTVLQQSDVLVCPSYAEGMPNVIMEGMASGCAIIGTNVGAVPIQVTEQNGWLIMPGSVEEIYCALKAALELEDEQLKSKKLSSLVKVQEEFTWEIISDKVITSFKRILKQGNVAFAD